jgi:hypothetical protein
MRPKKKAERPGALNELLARRRLARFSPFNGRKHRSDESPTFVVLMQHYSRRTELAGKAPGLEQRKQMALFFAVMAPVGKRSEKVEQLAGSGRVQRPPEFAAPDHLVQAVQHLFNHSVLLCEDFCRSHLSLLGTNRFV